jgi:hypothetical protein
MARKKYHVTFWKDEIAGITSVEVISENAVLCEGAVARHYLDQPNQVFARKAALKRAMAEYGISREIRSEIWNQLWESGMRKD